MGNLRRAGIAAAAAAAPLGLAYRFALAYRVRAGYPAPHPPRITPADLGLPYESTLIDPTASPCRPGSSRPEAASRGPGVVLVHGWESARDRTLPLAVFLHAAGFHCLTFDVRGHGENPPEELPLTAGEFGPDALAAFRRPDRAARGHRRGDRRPFDGRHRRDPGGRRGPARRGRRRDVRPGGPYRLTRQTFRLARLPIPDPIAYPLAWLTTRVYLRPRGHVVDDVSATAAIARYDGPGPARPRR